MLNFNNNLPPLFRLPQYGHNSSNMYGFSNNPTYSNYYKKNSNYDSNFSNTTNNNNNNLKTNSNYHNSQKSSNNVLHNDNKDSETKDFFEIFGLKLHFDDILLICLIFFLYKEDVHDEMLFVVLILLLLT